jgi:hypothetical protein
VIASRRHGIRLWRSALSCAVMRPESARRTRAGGSDSRRSSKRNREYNNMIRKTLAAIGIAAAAELSGLVCATTAHAQPDPCAGPPGQVSTGSQMGCGTACAATGVCAAPPPAALQAAPPPAALPAAPPPAAPAAPPPAAPAAPPPSAPAAPPPSAPAGLPPGSCQIGTGTCNLNQPYTQAPGQLGVEGWEIPIGPEGSQ